MNEEGNNPITWMIIVIFTLIVVSLINILAYNMQSHDVDFSEIEASVIEFKLNQIFLDDGKLDYNRFNQNYIDEKFNIDERNKISARIILTVFDQSNKQLEEKVLFFNKNQYERDSIKIGTGINQMNRTRYIPLTNHPKDAMGLIKLEILG